MIIDDKCILNKEKIDWLRYNDKIYSILSKKILSAF